MKFDINTPVKSTGWKKVKITDRTKNSTGQPTSLAMYRLLTKTMRNV